jgi:hypothetical protein
VPASPTPPLAELLVFRFGPGAAFEGRLVGALERLESGGALRVLDGLIVRRGAKDSEPIAFGLGTGGPGGFMASLLDLRLDPGARRRITDRALAAEGAEAGLLRELSDELEPGGAIVAILVEHVWRGTLADAVARTGGSPAAGVVVEASTLAEVAPQVRAAAHDRAVSS